MQSADIETFLKQIGVSGPRRSARGRRDSFASRHGRAAHDQPAATLPVLTAMQQPATGRPIDMPWPMARAVIDVAAENAQTNGEVHFALSFHGGGEPTLNWSVLTAAVAHARALPLSCDISLASNGVWSPQITDFICRNIDLGHPVMRWCAGHS